jgi:hypothetical protein
MENPTANPATSTVIPAGHAALAAKDEVGEHHSDTSTGFAGLSITALGSPQRQALTAQLDNLPDHRLLLGYFDQGPILFDLPPKWRGTAKEASALRALGLNQRRGGGRPRAHGPGAAVSRDADSGRSTLPRCTAQHRWVTERSFDSIGDLLGHGVMEHMPNARDQP